MNEEEKSIADRTRYLLREHFPLYEESHWAWAMRLSDRSRLAITYRESQRSFVTNFNLNIDGDCCYILTFWISEQHWRKGHGTKLYDVVRMIAKEQGCKRIRATPSGFGVEFWPKMGMKPCGGVELEEILD